jgi:hypothetical protein
MSKQLEIQTREEMPMAAPSPAQMMQQMIKSGVTAENVAAFKELAELSWRFEERDAKRQFAAAFVRLQKKLPVIVASSVIPNRGKYERFEDVMKVVGPLLAEEGFSVSFSQEQNENRITATCHLMHEAGETHTNPFTVRVGGRADSETQADCKASTTAKRNALLQALNIVIRQDCLQSEDDPRNEGGFITEEQAEELQRRVAETESNELAFLKFCGVSAIAGKPSLTHYKSIGSNRYDAADEMLRRKEQAGR